MLESLPPAQPVALDERTRAFLDDAEARIESFVQAAGGALPSFVPSDYVAAYAALAALAERDDLHSRAFCEWGSGFGVVAGLGAMLGFEATGIEIEPDLVDAAEQLTHDHELEVTFVEGSFVPADLAALVDESEGVWLADAADDGYASLDLEPDDFGVIYAYPWPGNESLYERLFREAAAPGAFLVMHRGLEGTTIQRRRVD